MNQWAWKDGKESGTTGPAVLAKPAVDILRPPAQTIAVVGMAKNCGKTTALGYLIRTAAAEGMRVGVTSSGRDGELYDAVYGHPKPSIPVPSGSLVAGAKAVLLASGASLEVLGPTGAYTSAGEVVVARALETGYVEVIGCNRTSGIIAVRDALFSHGADLVLVDGAAGRVFHADPSVADSCIISTGAVISDSVSEIANAAACLASIFRLPRLGGEVLVAVNGPLSRGIGVIVREDGSTEEIPGSLIGREAQIAESCVNALAFAVPGAITDQLLRVVAKRKGITVIARDPTRVLASRPCIDSFTANGGALAVLAGPDILAVTTNPWSLSNTRLDAADLVHAVSCSIPDLRVMDVHAGIIGIGGAVYETRS